MIENKPIQWLFDAVIEHWNDMAENKYLYKSQSPLIKKYNPFSDCFACEIYFVPLLRKNYAKKACEGCPFTIYTKNRPIAYRTGSCGYLSSPYFKWCQCKSKWNWKEMQKYAIEIAQLFIDHYPGE